jgi:hypothetical protein
LKGFKEIVDITQFRPTRIRMYLNNVEETIPSVMNLFSKREVQITSLRMSEPSLDDVFAHYTGLTIEEAQKDQE